MAFRPVNLSDLVRRNPPCQRVIDRCLNPLQKAVVQQNSILGCALFLSEIHGYVLMQDKNGDIWVQHKQSPRILLPPGGRVFHVEGKPLPYDRWLELVHRVVRLRGKTSLDPGLSYQAAIMRVYNGQNQNSPLMEVDSRHVAISSRRAVLKALNPYIAHRSK